jgi:anthranilate phosphoribosyltransferase
MIREAIATLVGGRSLSMDEASAVMQEIMEGQATPSQLSAFVTALKIKGETAEEIAGMTRTMRAKSLHVDTARPVVDIVGTGGDRAGTFNISTTSAFVAAGAGLRIAKHGNRAATSKCGSADVLEALGVRLDPGAGRVSACLEEVGIAFMFAAAFHPAMKHAAAPRREIGIPTVFNLLGPLTNPAGALFQVLGVADGGMLERMAEALKNLGCRHALIVHGEDGLDEITVTAPSRICELKNGAIRAYSVAPEDFGLERAAPESLLGSDAAQNAAILRAVLGGEKGPRRDIVLLNSAAALVAGNECATLSEGIELARGSIDSGRALVKLESLIRFMQDAG